MSAAEPHQARQRAEQVARTMGVLADAARRIRAWALDDLRDSRRILADAVRRIRPQFPARVVVATALGLAALALAGHLLAAAALHERIAADHRMGPIAAGDVMVDGNRVIIAAGTADRVMLGPRQGVPVPVMPAGVGASAIHLLPGSRLLIEDGDGELEVIRPGARSALMPLRSIGLHWRATLWKPVAALADRWVLSPVIQVDPWLTIGRAAPRRLGARRDCGACPMTVELSAGRAFVGPLLWQRQGAAARSLATLPPVAVSEPITTTQWNACRTDGLCSTVPGSAGLASPGGAEEVAAFLKWLRARTGRAYRLPTIAELDAWAWLAGHAPHTFVKVTILSNEWACGAEPSAGSPPCSMRHQPVPSSSAPALTPVRVPFRVVAP